MYVGSYACIYTFVRINIIDSKVLDGGAHTHLHTYLPTYIHTYLPTGSEQADGQGHLLEQRSARWADDHVPQRGLTYPGRESSGRHGLGLDLAQVTYIHTYTHTYIRT